VQPALLICHAPSEAVHSMLVRDGVPLARAGGPIGSPEDLESLNALIDERQDIVLVLDTRELPPRYLEALRDTAFLVCLDDDQYRNLDCDMIVNPNPWADAGAYAARLGRRVLAGVAANLIAEAFFVVRRGRDWLPEKPTVLVTMGGEDPDNVTAAVVAALDSVDRPMHLVAVIGPAFTDHARLAAAVAASHHDAVVVSSPDNMAALMAGADIAVAAGGTTCYELVAAGVLTIAVALAEHQQPTILDLQQRGAIFGLPGDGFFEPAGVRKALARLLEDAGARRSLQTQMGDVFAGPGAAYVVSKIVAAHDADRVGAPTTVP
jgi:spore coat polysaccharide biosynthesis predicted glycosyltransferase SpsG